MSRPRLAASPSPTVALVACAASSPLRKPFRLASTALPSARIAPSNAAAGIGSRPQPAMSPSMTALTMAPLCLANVSMSRRRLDCECCLDRLDQPCAVVAPVGHRHSLDHQIGTGGRCDHQRAVRRDETAGDGAARFHELARQHDIDVANAGRQRQHRPRRQAPAPAPERSRCNRSWRRCAERRRESTSIARGSRAARRRRRSSP